MRFLSLSLALLLTGAVSGQEVLNESFSDKDTNNNDLWSLTGPATASVTRGKTDTRSIHGKVDEITTASNIVYARTPYTLSAGTYVATVSIEKYSATTNAEDFTLEAITGASPTPSMVIPVADQALDTFIYSRTVLFTLTSNVPVLFRLFSKTTTAQKDTYRFDSFQIGKVENGRAVLVEALTRRWGHAWGCPHYSKEVRDTSSTMGFVERLNQNGSAVCGTGSANLWWFRWNSEPKQFLPGVHTANMKIQKIVSTAGAHNFLYFYQVSTDNGTTWTNSTKMLWLASRHTLNEWVYSPNLSFNVTNPNHLYRFRLDAYTNDPELKQTNSYKSNYTFDTFEVRRGEFSPIGSSCMNNGLALMEGNIPQLGQQFDIEVGPLGSLTPITMILGLNNPNVDLSAVGWAGCYQHATLDILVGMTVANSAAKLSVTIPNNSNLIGVVWYTQAFHPGSSAVTTTNGMKGTIGN